ncbi:MAG TPA: CRISPR-associated endonuclease Cas1 [Myxococcota bacterium]|nr:CRISPR-associated endonuclease Cas1 [Myxococcota bacterium]
MEENGNQPDSAKTPSRPEAGDIRPRGPGGDPPIPVRMLNEYAYCPRLGYLMWVQGEFQDSVDTLDGRFQHRRVDRQRSRRKRARDDEGGEDKPVCERAVSMTSEKLGLTAKIDLVEGQGSCVTPVEYKRGKRPHVAGGVWEPEKVQLCAQGVILRENGFECSEGVIYFAGSRERVRVSFDDALVAQTIRLTEEFRRASEEGVIPPPLEDSPKCPRCALAPICLPDEIRFVESDGDSAPPRMLFTARDDALPLHVQHQGARIGKDGDTLKIMAREELLAEARLQEISHVVLFGAIQVSTPAIQELCKRGISISYLSMGGWFYGITHGMIHKNVELRLRQFDASRDPRRCLALARRFVHAKITNCRTMLRRNTRSLDKEVLRLLREDARRAEEAENLGSLLGIEGMAAQRYFGSFPGMIAADDIAFDFRHRNRRPPKDSVNAMLSLAYAMLAREWTATLLAVGFDPLLGFFHQPRYGRPALALDLMEEFRPLIADSVVLTSINNGEVKGSDFIETMGGVALTASGRRKFIKTYERRMSQEVTHPVFGYVLSYRRVLGIQARLLGRFLAGEISDYPAFITR